MITLRPMHAHELEAWRARLLTAYVADLIGSGEPAAFARRTAEAQDAGYFPDGRPAEGHEVLVAEVDGRAAGVVWWGPFPPRPDDRTAAWIYEIEVDEAHRGRGLGRVLLAALEDRLRGAGVTELSLNVFGGNDTARRLYLGAGFREVKVQMAKRLD